MVETYWMNEYSLAKWAAAWSNEQEPRYHYGPMADFIRDYLDDKWNAYIVLESLEAA